MIHLLIPVLASLAAPQPAQSAPSAEELAAWRAAAAWSEQRGGVSFLVRKGGEVVFEQYVDGHGAEKPFVVFNGCQGMWAVAAVAADQDGLLGLDERVADTLESWRGVAGKQDITVRQLLTMESGLAANDNKVRDAGTRDRYLAAVEAPMVALPGESFRFGPTAWYVFAAVLEAKLAESGEDALDYLKRRVLDPIGMEVYYWGRDRAEHLEIPTGGFLTAREWSKFGQLVLGQGRLADRQVIEPAKLAECFRPSRLNPAYGMGFWLVSGLDATEEKAVRPGQTAPEAARERQRAAALPQDIVFSSGHGNQRLYVIPSKDLVLVRQGLPGSEFSDADFLRLVLGIDRPPAGGR
jgi:CubicO group peptidase (beta-lactamase class C family)